MEKKRAAILMTTTGCWVQIRMEHKPGFKSQKSGVSSEQVAQTSCFPRSAAFLVGAWEVGGWRRHCLVCLRPRCRKLAQGLAPRSVQSRSLEAAGVRCAPATILERACPLPLPTAHCSRLSSAAAAHWLFGFSNFASSMGTLCFTSVSLIVKLKSDRT